MISLFICSMVPWTVGNSLVPLLPVYARKLGAKDAVAGYYMAFSYLAIAIGAISAGWVSERLHHRKIPLFLAAIIGCPLSWLIGQVENVWGLTILTALLWFFGGLGLALVSILAGMFAGKTERGKVFGILSLASGAGTLIGGLSIGYLASMAGLLVLALATALWHFAIAISLQAIALGATSTVGNALVTDFVPKAGISWGIALYGSTGWIGEVLGFALTGFALQQFGTLPTLMIGISLIVIACVLLLLIQPGTKANKHEIE